MTSSIVVTTRLNDALSQRVDRLADKIERSRAWIVAKAVERYIDEELSLLESIEEAEDQIDRGEYFTQEQMEAWVDSLRRPAAAE